MTPSIRQSASPAGDTVYWPQGRPPRGGVVCLHGSEGGFAGWNDLNCALLAANGFVALAHNYSRSADWLVHPDIDDVPLEGAETAMLYLKAELAPYRCGVALLGHSRGAECALLLAQLLAEADSPALPHAVAAHSPPDKTWPAFIVSDFQTGRPWAGDENRSAWSWRGAHDRTKPGTLLGATAASYPVLISQGTEDEVWSADMARRLVVRMTDAGRPPEAHFFDGEGHVFRTDARNREWDLLFDFFDRHLSSSGG
jgi:acetyl esterase/lipase